MTLFCNAVLQFSTFLSPNVVLALLCSLAVCGLRAAHRLAFAWVVGGWSVLQLHLCSFGWALHLQVPLMMDLASKQSLSTPLSMYTRLHVRRVCLYVTLEHGMSKGF